MSMPNKVELPIDIGMEVNAGARIVAQTGIDADIRGEGALTMTLLGDTRRPVAAQITIAGDPERPVTANVGMGLHLENLPKFTLEDIYGLIDRMKPSIRTRMPFYLNFGVSVFPFNLFKVDVLQLSFCGEPQIIVEDYEPNAYERCEVECPPCAP